MTVNKSDLITAAAALNLYMTNRDFSGDFALQFDMFLLQNSSSTQQSKNETALFGIDHSGSSTNWIRNAVPGTGNGVNAYTSDGIFATVEADASTTLNYALWSGPTWTNTVAVVGPTNFLAKRSTVLTDVFKKPPFDAGPAAGGVSANTVLNPTPTWVSVEISQVGNKITWKMDNVEILSFINTNKNISGFTNRSGKIMLGYNDPWDDIGNGSANSGEAAVIYDNVRVIALAGSPSLTAAISATGLNLTISSTSVGFDYVVEYKTDIGAATWQTLTTVAGTGNAIVVPVNTTPDAQRFYRVRVVQH